MMPNSDRMNRLIAWQALYTGIDHLFKDDMRALTKDDADRFKTNRLWDIHRLELAFIQTSAATTEPQETIAKLIKENSYSLERVLDKTDEKALEFMDHLTTACTAAAGMNRQQPL